MMAAGRLERSDALREAWIEEVHEAVAVTVGPLATAYVRLMDGRTVEADLPALGLRRIVAGDLVRISRCGKLVLERVSCG